MIKCQDVGICSKYLSTPLIELGRGNINEAGLHSFTFSHQLFLKIRFKNISENNILPHNNEHCFRPTHVRDSTISTWPCRW